MELLPDKIKAEIQSIIKAKYGSTNDSFLIETPESEQHGHYSTNVAMTLAKELKKKPTEIADEISYELIEKNLSFKFDSVDYPIFQKIETAGPGFINFYLSLPWLMSRLYEIWTEKDSFGDSAVGHNKKVLVEYSQPNPNKPMHIGHSRNNFLGNSLCKIFSFIGYDVVRINYVNDWGTHICKAMLMYKKLADGTEPDIKADHFVGRFYKAYEQNVESEPALAEELSELFRSLEAGDSQSVELWKKIVGWAHEGHQETYTREGVGFDVWMHQHDYKDSGKEIVQEVMQKGIAQKDASGAIIARLEAYGLPDKVLLRSDGTSIYSTQDLQMAKDNYDKYLFDRKIYITDYRQSDYFKQIFKILEIFGFEWAGKLHHLGYGTVDLPDGTMSSRTGRVINADEVLDKLVSLEEEELAIHGKNVQNVREVALKVALSAYKYSMLKIDPQQIVVFDYDKVTKFDGNTGPYLLYTYARANSIIEKGGLPNLDPINFAPLNLPITDVEKSLLSQLYRLEEVVLKAAERYSPSEITAYVYSLCQLFNSFYAKVSVLSTEDEDLKDFRLVLIRATTQVIKSSLNLLGIEVVEKM